MGLKNCILIVEDDDLLQQSLKDLLEDFGYSVCGIADTAEKAVELAMRDNPWVVLMDVRLDGPKDGIDAAHEIHERTGTPIVFITGSKDSATRERIYQDHPSAVLAKPMVPSKLKSILRHLAENSVS